jgi:hypothetical protein
MSERKKRRSAPPKGDKDRPQKRGPRGSGRRSGTVSTVLRILAVPLVIMAFPLAVAGAFIAMSLVGHSSQPKELRAAIVDQLGLTEPNPAFTEEATRTLQAAGYTVDYYPGEQVTVDFYRDLPTHKYDLLVMRAHTARFEEESLTLSDPVRRQEVLDAFGQDVFFFTSELYDKTKYPDEVEKFRLFQVRYRAGYGDERFFGVTPYFIDSSMRGSFDGATIIIMGCDGLLFDNTPKALVDKGAKAVIGWDGLVSAAHTDEATERLLQYLVVDGLPMGEAVQKTMAEVGTDSEYGNSLRVYPEEARSLVLR